MASQTDDEDITHRFRFFQVRKDGRVELFYHFFPHSDPNIPASDDPSTGVRSKDVIISSHPPVSARIYLPKSAKPDRKLPLLLYIHGGGFCMESAFSSTYHSFVGSLVAEASVMAVSVEYGLFPDWPIPCCYDESFVVLQWIASHSDGDGPDAWLNDHADLKRVFIGGDSAGANITHTVASRVGSNGLGDTKVVGLIMVHPFFGGMEDDEMWMYMFPGNQGLEDPRLKPATEDLAGLVCERVLIFLAEKDHLLSVGKSYVEELKKSGWHGSVEVVESLGEEHCFHLFKPTSEKALDLVAKFSSFLNKLV